jgi:hypothetical protein
LKLNKIGNQATFGLQLKILLEQNEANFVYFAEDDYYFFPDQFRKMINLMIHNPDVHFVSPYEHPDYYSLSLHDSKYKIKFEKMQHWRSCIGTTCSFLTTKHILNLTQHPINTYYKNSNYDISLWMSLTKYHVLNPFKIGYFLIKNRDYFKMVARAWIHCWRQILFGKKWLLWVPMPSIATHMESNFMAPGFDWNIIFKKDI